MVGWAMEKGRTYKVLSTFVLSPEPSREAYREAEKISTCKAVCPTVTVLDIHRGPGPIVWYHVELQSGRGGMDRLTRRCVGRGAGSIRGRLVRDVIVAFEKAEATSSRNEKIEALRELQGESRCKAISLMDALLNPFKTYGVSAPRNAVFQGSIGNSDIELAHFLDLLKKLESRQLTGHTALTAVRNFLESCKSGPGRWFQRIINGEGPRGVGWATVQAGLGYEVPYFSCQLADTWDGMLDPSKNCIVEPKLDGMRCLLILDPKAPRALSRNGKPIRNMESVVQACMAITDCLVIDGELFAGSWEASITAGKAEGSKVKKSLWAFDAVPLDDFRRRSSSCPLRERKATVAQFRGIEGITIVPHRTVTTPEEVTNAAQDWVENGFEGAVLKDLDAPYFFDRGCAWQKVKFFRDQEFSCVDVYEGNGRLRGTLGGIVVAVDGVKVGVGTGFNDLQREELWLDQSKIVGRLVTVKYQRKSPDGALIFPVFLRVRDRE